jgi:ABC-type transport system substrate-binding protein
MNARLGIALLAVAGSLLAGCSGGGGFSQRESGKGNVFRYPIVTAPTTLDPAKVQDGDTIDAVQQVFEGLVGWSTDNTVVPILAEKWEVSPDGRTYTFTLKEGAKFSNGRQITAEDFKWCAERACDPKFNSPTAATYMADIVGVKERLAGKANEVEGIEVIDSKTLKITIDKPRPYFLGKMTYPTYFVYAKEAIKDPIAELGDITQMVGTGAFKFESYVPDQLLVMAANKDYHGGAPKVDKIERPIVKDAQTRLNSYKTGEIDLIPLEREDVKPLQADPKYKDQLKLWNRPALWYIGLNVQMVKPFGDRRVRRAFAMAIDRDKIVNDVLGGINQKAESIVPPGVFGHREDSKALPYNVAEAKKLLAEAGYPGGKGFPELEMYFREQRPDIRIVAEAVASQLKENLGVNVKLRTMEWRAYLEKHNAKEIPFFHMRWAADYLDAENFLSTLLAGYGAENKIYYENPAYDALTSKADTSMDPEERKRLYAQAEDIVIGDAPFIPIYFQRDAELVNPRIKGIRESLFGHLPHTQIEIVEVPAQP